MCRYKAPSQAAQPARAPVSPEYPFSHLSCDFFYVGGLTYFAVVDRFSNWLTIARFNKDESKSIIKFFHNYFSRFGIAKEITSDGQKSLCSLEIEDFLARWGVKHRVSSAYHPVAHKRGEVAVKQAKRLIEGNLGPRGQLETERLARALLEHRNTPDPLTGLSPAMIVYGRKLRGFLPDGSPPSGNSEWRIDMEAREKAFAKRQSIAAERMNRSSRILTPLVRGDEVSVQDPPTGGKAGRWSKSGTIVECLPFDAYLVRIHGSRAVSQRNRIHLRKILPLAPEEIIVPTTSPEMTDIPEATKTEITERFVSVQPPRQRMRLSPEKFRQEPAAQPGEDVVQVLKRKEAEQSTASTTSVVGGSQEIAEQWLNFWYKRRGQVSV